MLVMSVLSWCSIVKTDKMNSPKPFTTAYVVTVFVSHFSVAVRIATAVLLPLPQVLLAHNVVLFCSIHCKCQSGYA